jgi:predicted aspartyl protease
MSTPFNPQRGLILVLGEVEGPSGKITVRLALDTGATDTLVTTHALVAAGYDPALASKRVQVTTGGGLVTVPVLTVARLSALGQDRINFPVFGHTLPPSAPIDGLLGLNFFRGQVLTIDFRNGQLTLA